MVTGNSSDRVFSFTRAWPPTLVEWAFSTLPEYLDEKDGARCSRLVADWESSSLGELSNCEPEHRIQTLVILTRHTWHQDMMERVGSQVNDILDSMSLGEYIELASLTIESGQLRLAEQEDLEPEARIKTLMEERTQILEIRERLREAAIKEQVDKKEECRTTLKRLTSMARRLHNQADEASILNRLEGIFGRRAWSVFSKFTFYCLILLLILLFLDFFMDKSNPSGFVASLPWIDSSICMVFLTEFLLRLACAPRKGIWFVRHFLTDFAPAIPFAILLPTVPGGGQVHAQGGWEFGVRMVRLYRIPIYAKYVRILKPPLALFRIFIFMVRGMDRIVQSMAPILNRQIIFFEHGDKVAAGEQIGKDRSEIRIMRGFNRLSPHMRRKRAPELLDELEKQVEDILSSESPHPGCIKAQNAFDPTEKERVMQVEDMIFNLQKLTPEEIENTLTPSALRGLGRLLGLMDIPILRSLPIVSMIASAPKGSSPAERIARAGRACGRIARKIMAYITGWADLSGVVTAPQIVDRLATALMRSTQRPAVRLLLFGGLFLLAKFLFGFVISTDLDSTAVGAFLNRFVATPILVLGGVCLVLLIFARWLKKVAGEASDRLLRSAEARFANLLELIRLRKEKEDISELCLRVAGHEKEEGSMLAEQMFASMKVMRRGEVIDDATESVRSRKLALLMLDMEDAGFLHRTDKKAVEQFLSHPDLWNLRNQYLKITKKEKKRLGRLDLESGSHFSGSFLWFELATFALAVKVARLCGSYNLHLLSKNEMPNADDKSRSLHRDLLTGSGGLKTEPDLNSSYKGSFFHVLHFLSPDPLWLDEVEEEYGGDVKGRLLKDRRRLIRELFGTRALRDLPREKRSFNPLFLYQRHMSSGRFIELPFKGFIWFWRLLWMVIQLGVRSAREILDPRLRGPDRVDSSAPFSVARRKLRKMKKPLLFDAILLTARLDPFYLGLTLSGDDLPGSPQFRKDLDLVEPTPMERTLVENVRSRVSKRLLYLPDFLRSWDRDLKPASPEMRRIAAAFAMDEKGIASAAAVKDRVAAWVNAARLCEGPPPGRIPPLRKMVKGSIRTGLKRIFTENPSISREGRRFLRQACRRASGGDFHTVCSIFGRLKGEDPFLIARSIGEEILKNTKAFIAQRETLHAVLTLIIQDLRHHVDLIYELGGYDQRS